MAKVTTFTGIDISKLSFDVCILTEGDKEKQKQFVYDKEGMEALVQWLPADSHCVMEATGIYHLRLACHLSEKGIAVSVVNPLVIKRFSQMRLTRAKTDRSDARMIAAYGKTEQPALWQPPKAYQVKLQQMDALLQQLQKQHSALLCQREAFTAGGMMDKEVKQILQTSVSHLDKQILRLENNMEVIITEHQGQMADNITTIPGIGKKTAIVLMVLSDCFQKFRNYKQLSAYVGLSPRIYESGTSIKGKAKICRMGMSRIRALLYVCAWSASRYNKACKELYERLTAAGKPKKLALVAVANKLIKQVFAIATGNTQYQENYSKNSCF